MSESPTLRETYNALIREYNDLIDDFKDEQDIHAQELAGKQAQLDQALRDVDFYQQVAREAMSAMRAVLRALPAVKPGKPPKALRGKRR